MPTAQYVFRDPQRGSYHFLHFSPLTRRWVPDLMMTGQIRNARMRLYHLANTPSGNLPPYYAEYQYATVDDDATLTLLYELRDASVVSNFSDIRMAGAGLHRDYVRDTVDPHTEDRIFREHRAATLNSIEPPRELTRLLRVVNLLMAAGDHGLPAPLSISHTPQWGDLSHAEHTDTGALAALLRRQGDDTAGVAQGGEAVWDRMVNPDLAVQIPAAAVEAPRRNIADAMIRDAISQKAQCPISMEPITQETAACVAPCYHVFCQESIAQWMERETTCPTCREPCRL